MTKKRRVCRTIQSSNGRRLKLKVTACCPQICITGCSLPNHGPPCNAGSVGRIRWEQVGVLGCTGTMPCTVLDLGMGHLRVSVETGSVLKHGKRRVKKMLSHQMTPGQPAWVVNTCGNRSADTTEFCLPANIPESSGFSHSVIYLSVTNSKLI